MTNTTQVKDAAEAARRARFGRLPERVRPQDTVQELPAAQARPGQPGDDQESATHFLACIAGHLA